MMIWTATAYNTKTNIITYIMCFLQIQIYFSIHARPTQPASNHLPRRSANAHIVLAVLVERRLVLLSVEHQGDLFILIVVHKLLVQLLGTDNVLLDVGALLVSRPICWRVDVDLRLLEVLLV